MTPMAGSLEPTGPAEEALVGRQLGRPPRLPWRTGVRCSHERPMVIVTPSTLESGERFPTLYWLSCPELVAAVGDLESAGGTVAWTARLASDRELVKRMGHADVAYRRARAAESGGDDACADVGIAGEADALKVKCLHAHVAAYLAGIDDPVGAGALRQVPHRGCADDLCRRLTFIEREER